MAELVFEGLSAALEATAGEAEAAPTIFLPLTGVLTPQQTVYRPEESRGIRAQFTRSKVVKKWATWETEEGGADTAVLPFLLNMAVDSVTTPTTPGGATLARMWAFARQMTMTGEKTGTFWWGDPNVQIFQGAFGVVDTFSITGDASGDNAVQMQFRGRTQAVEKVAAPVFPAQLVGPMVTPLEAEVWIDTGTDPIGTTMVSDRVISAAFDSGTLRGDPKFVFAGPAANKTYSRFGVTKSSATLALRLELPDTNEFDLLDTEARLKVRVKFNGPEIEPGFWHSIIIDTYGIFDEPAWSDFAGSNRALDLTITSEYDDDAGHDWQIVVINDRDTLA